MTLDQAQEYLETMGVDVPDFILSALIEQIDTIKDCLEENYSPATVLLIYSYLLSLMVTAQSGRYIANRGLSGGLYQGFRYKDDASFWKGQLSLLRSFDTKGCTESLIPDNPFSSANGLLLTVRTKGCMR